MGLEKGLIEKGFQEGPALFSAGPLRFAIDDFRLPITVSFKGSGLTCRESSIVNRQLAIGI